MLLKSISGRVYAIVMKRKYYTCYNAFTQRGLYLRCHWSTLHDAGAGGGACRFDWRRVPW